MVVWLKRFAWVVGIVVLLALLAWAGVPALIKWQAPPRLSALLGRAVTIGDVGFKPWALSLTVDRLAIAGPTENDPPLLTVGHLLADVSASSLFKLAPVIEALEIDTPDVHVARTSAGHYDIDDLIARFTPTTPPPTPSEPARFALYNLQLRDGRIAFDDRPVKQVQKVEALHLALPFISNLPAEVDVKVEPHLAFKLNGTPFDSGAAATPFAKTKSGVLKLAVADLDLAPYLGYLPADLPVRLQRGSVSADVDLNFAVPPGGTPSVTLHGTAGAKNLALADAAGAPLLDWKALTLKLRDVQPLARKLAFETLRVDGLQVHATRDAAGRINLLGLASSGEAAPPPAAVPAATAASTSPPMAMPASAATAASAASAASAAASAATPAAPGAWQVSLDGLSLADTRVLWNDAAVQPTAELLVDGLNVEAKKIQWPINQPIALTVNGALRPQAAASGAGSASFTVEGPVTDRVAKLKIAVKDLALASFAPYAAQALRPTLEGKLQAQAELEWSGEANKPLLKVALEHATLDGLALRETNGKTTQDALALKQLALADAQIDVLERSAVLGSVKFVQPSAVVERAADGSLNVSRWAAGASPEAAGTKPAKPARPDEHHAAGAPSEPAWHVVLKDLVLDGGAVKFSDASVGTPTAPMRLAVDALHVVVQGLEWHGDHAVAPGNVQITARVGAPARAKPSAGMRDGPRLQAGTLDYKGRLGLEPLLASGKLRIERVPVQLFSPYFAGQIPLALISAEAGYQGDVGLRRLPAGLDVSAGGNVLLGGVHVATVAPPGTATAPEELLSWQSLRLDGLKFAMKPQAKPQLEIAGATLSDFYSRLVITEQGRFNFQDVTQAPAGIGPQAPESAASSAAAASAPPSASAAIPSGSASAPAVAASAAAPDATPLPIDIKVGGIKLVNGKIDYSDHFVRPNYSAALTELNGELGAFSSTSRDAPTLTLHGRAAGTALLEISGKLNPTARPLALDIQAKATDLELAPLSPYAGKYAGYAIERGKLTMDVAYKIDPDGKLEARNQIVLNQLTFGDKIESKDATSLPVRLAVALLKDRNGVIDINLPISGSLNDPKFSIGGLIVKVIVNLLVKAVTSPFSLLSGGGGGDDLSVVEFQPGTAQFTSAGASAIEKVAKALTERPALTMTVTGAADPIVEREAYQHAVIEGKLAAEARRDSLRSGAVLAAPAAPASGASSPASAASSVPPPETAVALSEAEHARLLTRLYKDTEIPNKPRNALGFAKEIPSAEMEALIKSRTPVDDDAMRALALQRGLSVRDALIAKGLPSERLFLAAPQLRAAAEDKAANWTPRVQLSLTSK